MILIGELAKKTNISKRTLHYYEQIQLLQPALITENGYRYYDENAILRLQKILLLKAIGYTLDQIKELFQNQDKMGENNNWIASLNEQIELIEQKKEELSRKQYYLRSTIHTLQMKGMNNLEQLLRIISNMKDRPLTEGIIRPEFTSDDLQSTSREMEILNRLPILGSDDPRMDALLTIFQRVRCLMPSSPYSSEVQVIASQLYETALELFDRDEELLNKYWELIKPRDAAEPVVMGMDDEFMSYVDEMISFFLKQRGENADEGD